jgi:F0F1-type ATP synthase membrane subunit c/vacuolar-type H+-ATPase subunit K
VAPAAAPAPASAPAPAAAPAPAPAPASASATASVDGASATAGADSAPASNPDKARTGWILVGVGSAVAIGGLVVDIVGANTGHLAGMGNDNGQTDNSRTDLYFVGTSLIVAGIVTGIYGGSMVWSANHGQDTKASAPPADDAKNDGVTKVAQAKLASSPSFVVPVVSGSW